MLSPRLKIYPVHGVKNRILPWRSPFLDIFYFDKNQTHMYGRGHKTKLLSDVFPLSLRPFQGRMVPSPRDPRRYLTHYQRKDYYTQTVTRRFEAEFQCRGPDFNYLNERVIHKSKVAEVPCTQLFHLFPFVRHVRGEGAAYCKEELVFRGKILNVFYRTARGIPAC